MRCFRCAASCSLAFFLGVAAARAETPQTDAPPSPLRLLPDKTDLLIQAPEPRRLIETLTTTDAFKQIQQLAPVREFFDSTNVRRVLQLVAYFEKELGYPWPQLLDRLAGGGMVLGIQIGPDPAPLLLVIEGEDEKLLQQFFELGVKLLGQELARQESKDKPLKGSYKGITTVQIGSGFHAAVAGRALLVASTEKAIQAGLDRHTNRGKQSMAELSGVRESLRLLPSQPLLTFWLKMDKPRESPQAKALYREPPRDDPVPTVAIGDYLNLLGRTPYVCAAVCTDKDGLTATIRMPRGLEGMQGDQLLHIPPPSTPGSRPLLEPKNVLYSESKYFDIANLWKERTKLFNEKQNRQFEAFNKKSAPFLLGTKLSKLLTQAGPYYRFVAVHQPRNSYKKTPKISIPAFALVWELREPEAFGKSIEPVLRGLALLSGFQANLKLVDEQYKNCKIVGYRFPEDEPFPGDVSDLRFNFTPCFARVGDQFVASSTIELCRELVDLIHKEETSPSRGDVSPARARVYSSGVAAYLQTIDDLLITRTTLDQAVTPDEARQQVKQFLDLLRGLGVLELGPRYHNKTFQYDIRLRAEK